MTDSVLTARLRDNFLLESQIPRYADNLKSLRGFKFDWGRSDSNQDHVYAAWAVFNGSSNGQGVKVKMAVSRDRGETFESAVTMLSLQAGMAAP